MHTETTPKTGRPQELDVEHLLDVAEKLFADSGFEGATLRGLAAEAKCNPALIAYHFGSKDGLYQEVLLRHFKRMREKSQTPARSGKDLDHAWQELSKPAHRDFCEFIHGLYQSMMSAPQMQKILYRELMTGGTRLSSAISKSESGAFQLIHDRLARLQKEGELSSTCDLELTTLSLVSAVIYSMIAAPMLKKVYGLNTRSDAHLRELSLYQTRSLFTGWA